jgi:hypothetical protein
MKILILEDDWNRLEWFQNKFKDHQVFYATSYDALVYKYEKNSPFDIYLSDHDIEDMIHDDSPGIEYNGYEAAKYLNSIGAKFSQIIIHSCNPVGAENIYNEVRNLSPIVEVIPYYELKESIQCLT